MKFLVDAQLPYRLAEFLCSHGCPAIHTRDLPAGNRSSDEQIIALADRDERVVITKDSDFVVSHHLAGQPRKLLLISTGNLSNQELFRLIERNFGALLAALEANSFVELSTTNLLVAD